MAIRYSDNRDLPVDQVEALYRANAWTAAGQPELLLEALHHCAGLISAWDGDQLIGIGNAISDGFLVVYYPHLLVLPTYQSLGVGREIMTRLKQQFNGFHMHVLTADGDTVDFYQKCGFERAGQTVPMWIYDGNDH